MKNILILAVSIFVSLQCLGAPRQQQNSPRPSQGMSQPKPAANRPAPKPAPKPAPRPVVRRFVPPPPPPRPRVYFYPQVPTVSIMVVSQPQTIVVQQNAATITNSEIFAEAVKQELEAIYSARGVKQAFSIQITVRQLTANKNILSAEVEALFDVGGKKIGVVAEQAAYNQNELSRLIADKIAAAAVVD